MTSSISSKGCWACHRETSYFHTAYKKQRWLTYTCSLKCNMIFAMVMKHGAAEVEQIPGRAEYMVISKDSWQVESAPKHNYEKGSLARVKK